MAPFASTVAVCRAAKLTGIKGLPPAVSSFGGVNTLLPRTLFGYIWRASGKHQLGLALLSIAVFALSAVPLELQRRIVNDAIRGDAWEPILWLAAAYAGVALAEGGVKLALNIYRGWVSEAAVRHLRLTTLKVADGRVAVPKAKSVELSMVLSEVEPVGGFVGSSTSEPLLQGGILGSCTWACGS